MIKFAHIAPTKHILHAGALSEVHMALRHLVIEDDEYVLKFRILADEGAYIYLDNSQFELGVSCSVDELLEAGRLIGASCLILPDGDVSETSINEIKKSGYDVMVIPAGSNFIFDFENALANPNIDRVGLSYSKASEYMGRPRHSATSRFDFLNMLEEPLPNKKIHMLGAVSAGEISLMKPYEYAIESWDSSIAVWGGLCNEDIKNMSTKNPINVDFSSDIAWNLLTESNIHYIKTLQNI